MSSPSSIGGNNGSAGIREGTRVILREITANLQNSPPSTSPRRKTGNEASTIKSDQQHDVKVRFIREFAEATSTVRDAAPESNSLSSASSFQSLASTLSSKCSSGICVHSSPGLITDRSYINADISGLDDLIAACENIHLDDSVEDITKESPFVLRVESPDHVADQSFVSAREDSLLDRAINVSPTNTASQVDLNCTRNVVPIDSTSQVDLDRTRNVSPINCLNQDDLERTRNVVPIASPSQVDLDRTRNVSPINCLSQDDLNRTRDVPIASPSQVDLDRTRNVSPINCLSQDDLERTRNVVPIDSTSQVDLDRTRNVSPINCLSQDDLERTRNVVPIDSTSQVDLDRTRNVSPINCLSQDDLERTRNVVPIDSTSQVDLDRTRNVSPINCLSQDDLDRTRNVVPIDSTSQVDLDRTRNVSPINCLSQDDLDRTRNVVPLDSTSQVNLDRTRNVSPINCLSQDDLDRTRNVPSTDSPSQVELDRTRNVLSTDSPSHIDLDTTRDIQVGNLTIDRPNQVDLNLAKNLSEDLPKNNTDLDRTRTIDGETETPLANASYECRALDLNQAIPENCEHNSPSKNDECVEPVGQSVVAEEASKIENGPGLSDEIPLELIVPSFSDFRENLKNPVTEVNQSENSPTSLLEHSLNLKNEENSSNVEFTEILECPSLPTLNSGLPVQFNEISDSWVNKPLKNLLVSSQIPVEPIDGDRIPEIPRQEILQKFNTTDEFYRLDSISTIRDPTFLNDQNFVGNLVQPIVQESIILADLPKKNNLEEVPNFRPLEIDKVETPVVQSQLVIESNVVERSNTLEIIEPTEKKSEEIFPEKQEASIIQQEVIPKKEDVNSSDELNELDDTLTLDTSIHDVLENPEAQQFIEFLPQQQSTQLVSPKRPISPNNFAELEAAANSVANDILNVSIELAEDNERFVDASADLFDDPNSFDFLLSKTSSQSNTRRDLRADSLYVHFDPLVSRQSMLPLTNMANATPPVSEAARNGDNETNLGTNTMATIQKTNVVQEKIKSSEETSVETNAMAKELELLRTTVLQLEEQQRKRKLEYEEALEREASYKEKINQLQAQLAQEIKNKNEITVVVDEYEISISRLVAERERDRKNLDLERAKLQEELAATKHHLDNTEAAFNDVHLKYERLKAVVATYKSNEIALKESIKENVEIIKSLENRYEQVKSHATARLEKANQDLEAIRKQSESENVRLHAMLKKAELKSNSLAELVEQKTKENEELTQIFDEVIARVGHDKTQ